MSVLYPSGPAARVEHEKRRAREAQLRRDNSLREREQLLQERGGMRGGTLPGFRSPTAPG